MSAKHGGRPGNSPPPSEKMPAERAEIIAWLKKVKFRRRFFGGVDEANVWKKIAELDALYTKALEAERTRYNVLLAEYRQWVDERFRAELSSMKDGDQGG